MAQTKKASPKETQAEQTVQTDEQPRENAPAESTIESWFQEQILAKLGPISGQALITASHAHGARHLDWMAENLEVQGHADLAETYRRRKKEGVSSNGKAE